MAVLAAAFFIASADLLSTAEAGFAKAGAAEHASPPPCEKAETRAQAVIKFTPLAYPVETLAGDAAKEWIAAYNAVPPKTHAEADEIIAIASPLIPDRLFVIVALKGCVVLTGEITIKNHETLKAGPKPAGPPPEGYGPQGGLPI